MARPFGGWLADKYGGARVTFWTFAAMIAGTLAVLWTLSQLTPNPTQSAAIATDNQSWFPWFLAAFLLVFAATGIGNGSTYRMIPLIVRSEAKRTSTAATFDADMARATKHASAVIGIAGAVGALGGFLIPMTFAAPWIDDPVDAVQGAFLVFTTFYARLPAGHLVRLHPPLVPGRARAEPGRRRGLRWPRRRTVPTARCSAACGWSGHGRRRSRPGTSSR